MDRLVLVSGSEVGQRLAQHTNIIEAAKAAGHLFGAAGDARVNGAARRDFSTDPQDLIGRPTTRGPWRR